MPLVAIRYGDHLKLNGFLGHRDPFLLSENALFAEAYSELEASLAAGDSCCWLCCQSLS